MCSTTLRSTGSRIPQSPLVTELAVISFSDGQATLRETGPGVSIDQVLLATEAQLTIPQQVPQMAL
jgi:acetate CoA/acetoacetate CoA-transferase beta subunit